MRKTRIAAIHQRLEAATPGPWYRGDRFRHYEADENDDVCPACEFGSPVWTGRAIVHVGSAAPITGRLQLYVHFHELPPSAIQENDMEINAGEPPNVYLVAGQWGYEEGGVLSEEDAELIAHAPADIAYLLDYMASAEEVAAAALETIAAGVELPAKLRAAVDAHLERQSRSERR